LDQRFGSSYALPQQAEERLPQHAGEHLEAAAAAVAKQTGEETAGFEVVGVDFSVTSDAISAYKMIKNAKHLLSSWSFLS
jgi:hypothetical protein